eukprot:m.46753 g.46753  ORF g.46753 m.46753 type:complete len:370 (+) comp13173_c0_seq2:98-1207(+)
MDKPTTLVSTIMQLARLQLVLLVLSQTHQATSMFNDLLMLPCFHSGLGNQAIAMTSALSFANATNRILVLPPILPHFAVAFGPALNDPEVCARRSLSLIPPILETYVNVSRQRSHLRWTNLFDLSSSGVRTIPYQSFMNHSFHRKFVARCSRQETVEGVRAALETPERFLTVGSTYHWHRPNTHWVYPAAPIWKERVQSWLRRFTLPLPIKGMHLRVCDMLAKRWQRSRNSALTRQLTSRLAAIFENALNQSQGSTVYIASELYPGACEWNVIADITERLNILCIDGSMLELDDGTKGWVQDGHEWIPDFMVLTHITSSMEFVFMGTDCLSVESGSHHFRSSFSRLILETRAAVHHRDKIKLHQYWHII